MQVMVLLVRIQTSSNKLYLMLNLGRENIAMLMIFQIPLYQSHMISEIYKIMILLGLFAIRKNVGLVTLLDLFKHLKQG